MNRDGLATIEAELSLRLEQIRDFVQTYDAQTCKLLPLQRAMVAAHQIRGVLRLLECHGAAVLAGEMRQCLRHLIASAGGPAQHALVAVYTASLELEAYLGLVLRGGSDYVSLLSGSIDGLRAARNAPPLLPPAAQAGGGRESQASRTAWAGLHGNPRPVLAAQIRTELAALEDAIDLAQRAPEQAAANLEAGAWMAQRIGGALTMLGQDHLGVAWADQTRDLQSLGGEGADWMGPALGLVQLDQDLDQMLGSPEPQAVAAAPWRFLHTGSCAVLRAALDQMARFETLVLESETAAMGVPPAAARALLAEVAGGLRMLGHDANAVLAPLSPLVAANATVAGEYAQSLAEAVVAVQAELQRLLTRAGEPPSAATAAPATGAGPTSARAAPGPAPADADSEVDSEYAQRNAELIAVFVSEAGELLAALERQLESWAGDPDPARLESLRLLHTLKGGARVAELGAVADLGHALEHQLEHSPPDQTAQCLERLRTGAEQLRVLLERAAHEPRLPAAGAASHHRGSDAAGTASPDQAPIGNLVAAGFDARLFPPRAPERGQDAGLADTARVPVAALDEIFNACGRIAGLGIQLEQCLHELKAQRPRSAANAEPDRDPLDELVAHNEGLLDAQTRLLSGLQQSLMQTLLTPFAHQEPRLQRLVGRVAAEHGRKVSLEISGGGAELDRHVLEAMLAPIEHLLRNAVVHGIEAAAVRRQRGKPEDGRIRLRLARAGTQLLIDVEDDGAGLDLEAIRTTAVARGLAIRESAGREEDLAALIFSPGFSTVRTLTQVAGRGLGMDVVKARIRGLGGSVALRSHSGRGTCFQIRLPLALALSRVLLVAVGDERFAVPLDAIQGITRVAQADLEQQLSAAQPRVEFAARSYPLFDLGRLLGCAADPAAVGSRPLLVAAAGDRRGAFAVGALGVTREVVVKPVGAQVAAIPGVAGATILAGGEVVLILDLVALLPGEPMAAMAR